MTIYSSYRLPDYDEYGYLNYQNNYNDDTYEDEEYDEDEYEYEDYGD